MKHPANFYIAHRVFNLRSGLEWGALSDGPLGKDDMSDKIADSFDDEAPSLGNLRVWWFQDDVPARDVTEDFILAWELDHAPTEGEMEEQRLCDAADYYVHLQREYAA